MRNFGEVRVIEPKGSLPVTAWKVDNSRELKGREIRILLDYITMERDSMCQICSICEHDTAKIAGKIMKFVNERGKISITISVRLNVRDMRFCLKQRFWKSAMICRKIENDT